MNKKPARPMKKNFRLRAFKYLIMVSDQKQKNLIMFYIKFKPFSIEYQFIWNGLPRNIGNLHP